jgi:ribosomal protein S15P/S13E
MNNFESTVNQFLSFIKDHPEDDEMKRSLQVYLKTIEELDKNTKEIAVEEIKWRSQRSFSIS